MTIQDDTKALMRVIGIQVSFMHPSHIGLKFDYTAFLKVYDQRFLRRQEAGLDYFCTLLTSQTIELSEDILSSILLLVITIAPS